MQEQHSTDTKRERSSSQSINRLLQCHNLNDLVFGKRARHGLPPTLTTYPSVMEKLQRGDLPESRGAVVEEEPPMNQPAKVTEKSLSVMADGIPSEQTVADRRLLPEVQPVPLLDQERDEELPKPVEPSRKRHSDRSPAGERSKKALAREKLRNVAEMKDDDDPCEVRRHRKIIRKRRQPTGTTSRPQLNRIFHRSNHENKGIVYPDLTLRCDIYKMSLSELANKFGPFDVVVVDAHIRNVLTLDLGSLVEDGILFIWSEHNEVQLGYHLLRWAGFDVIDQIVWVQTDSEDQLVCRPGNLTTTASSICMVAIKNKPGKPLEYRTKISNNLVFAEHGQTPRQIYEIAELMMPGSLKLDIFNKRELPGWLCVRHQPSMQTEDTKITMYPSSSDDKCAMCDSTIIYQISFHCETCKILACRNCLFSHEHPVGHEWKARPIHRPVEEYKTLSCFHCEQPVHYGERCYACENCSVWVCTRCEALPQRPQPASTRNHCHTISHNLTLLV